MDRDVGELDHQLSGSRWHTGERDDDGAQIGRGEEVILRGITVDENGCIGGRWTRFDPPTRHEHAQLVQQVGMVRLEVVRDVHGLELTWSCEDEDFSFVAV